MLERNHVDGLIFLTNHPDDGRLAALIDRAGRVVVVDEDVPGAQRPASSPTTTRAAASPAPTSPPRATPACSSSAAARR